MNVGMECQLKKKYLIKIFVTHVQENIYHLIKSKNLYNIIDLFLDLTLNFI